MSYSVVVQREASDGSGWVTVPNLTAIRPGETIRLRSDGLEWGVLTFVVQRTPVHPEDGYALYKAVPVGIFGNAAEFVWQAPSISGFYKVSASFDPAGVIADLFWRKGEDPFVIFDVAPVPAQAAPLPAPGPKEEPGLLERIGGGLAGAPAAAEKTTRNIMWAVLAVAGVYALSRVPMGRRS